MKDRLIEILKQFTTEDCKITHQCGYCDYGELVVCASAVADHLLANGVIVPPVKVGQTVYDASEFIDGHPYAEIYEFSADEITISKDRKTGEYIFSFDGMDYTYDEFGKTVFLTKEEAEKALAERSEK